MNHAIVLAAGIGQRMRSGGLPKQFLKLMGKPIIIYTLEKFEASVEIDDITVACHGSYVEHMNRLLQFYQIKKVNRVVVGGSDRQGSLQRGLDALVENGGTGDDIVVIHDGVRPLVTLAAIHENIRVAKQYGCAITVHPVTETVVVTGNEAVGMSGFQKRSDTYSLTSPQTFRLGKLIEAYRGIETINQGEIPLLDAAMVYAGTGGEVHLVKEQGANIKITTPEDFYFLKALLELEENKYIFGL